MSKMYNYDFRLMSPLKNCCKFSFSSLTFMQILHWKTQKNVLTLNTVTYIRFLKSALKKDCTAVKMFALQIFAIKSQRPSSLHVLQKSLCGAYLTPSVSARQVDEAAKKVIKKLRNNAIVVIATERL